MIPSTVRAVAAALLLLALSGCQLTPPFQQEAWEHVKSDLKAPSTAKLAEFKAYDASETLRKEIFLRSRYDLQWAFKLREGLKKEGFATAFGVRVLMDYLQKPDAEELVAELKLAAPSQAKQLDEIVAAPVKAQLDGVFRPSKANAPRTLFVVEALIKKLGERELQRLSAAPGVEAKQLFLDYDAQNSYGAMLRGHAHLYGLKTGNLVSILDPTEPFDRAVLGLPAEPGS